MVPCGLHVTEDDISLSHVFSIDNSVHVALAVQGVCSVSDRANTEMYRKFLLQEISKMNPTQSGSTYQSKPQLSFP